MRAVIVALLALVVCRAMPTEHLSPVNAMAVKQLEGLGSGFVDFVKGFGIGFVEGAKEDWTAFPACFFGFQCMFEVIMDFADYLKHIEHFDIVDFFKKVYSILFMGLFECAESCLIPATYIMHFEPFLNGFTLENLKEVLVNGVVMNVLVLYFNGQEAYNDFMHGNFYGCGYNIGYIFWCVLIR